MTARGVIVAGLVLFGGAVYGLHTEKMRVVTVCRDARLFMDGGYDAAIAAGGINLHHSVTIYKKHFREEVPVGSIVVTGESSPVAAQQVLTAPNLKFSLFRDQPPTLYGTPARLEANLGKEKISVSLLCRKK